MKKTAVDSLFFSSCQSCSCSADSVNYSFWFYFFLLVTTYQFLLFVSYLSFLPSLLCLLSCLSVGYIPVWTGENTTSRLPVICSWVCITFYGRVSIWPSKYRIFFLGKGHTQIHLRWEEREKWRLERLCHLYILSEKKNTLEYQILIWIVEMKRMFWNMQSHWLLLLQQQPQLLRMSLEGVLGVKSSSVLYRSLLCL